MTFTIDQIYKEGLPRKQQYRSPMNTLASGSTDALEVSPSTSPAWAILVEKLKFFDNSLATSGTGTGVLAVEYPDYTGSTTLTYTFNETEDLEINADECINAETTIYSHALIFRPPILIKGSSTYNTLTCGLPTNVDVSSGTFKYMFTGWTLKEEDYD